MAELSEKLDLRARGTMRGKAGLPPINSETYDEVETEITEAIRTYALSEERRTYAQIMLYDQRLQSADPLGAAADMRTIATQSVNQFEAEIVAAKNDLRVSNEAVQARRAAVKGFQLENGITRPVDLPRSHWVLGGVLLVLFLIESLPNALLFSAGAEEGILGGYAIAVIASALNIGGSFIAGLFAWRNAIHKNPYRRGLGLAFGLVWIAFVILLNLTVAHFRDAVSAGLTTDAAGLYVTQQLIEFNIRDIISAALAIVGIAFAAIAALEGYYWIDPYPGYTKVSRALSRAENSWSAKVEQRLNLLDAVQRRYAGELKTARSSLRDRRAAIPDIISQRARLIRSFALHIDHLQGVGRFALAVYRDANMAARPAGTAAPARFNVPWVLDGIDTFSELSTPPPVAAEDWEASNAALEESMNQIQNAFSGAIEWINELEKNERTARIAGVTAPQNLAPVLVANGRAA